MLKTSDFAIKPPEQVFGLWFFIYGIRKKDSPQICYLNLSKNN